MRTSCESLDKGAAASTSRGPELRGPDNCRADDDRFLALLDEHKGIPYKVANAYCRNHEDRNELLPEIVIHLWRSFDRFDARFCFSTKIRLSARFARDRADRLLYERLMRKGLGNPWRREALFGGTGEVLVWDLMGGARFPPFTAVLACELAPGGRVGVHRQEQYPEIVIVTEGVGTAKVDGSPCPLEIGTVIALPLGSTLALANSSESDPLRYLIIKAEAVGAQAHSGHG